MTPLPPPSVSRGGTDVDTILRRLAELKVELTVEDGKLRFRPRDGVPADLLEQMRLNKANLLIAVRRRIATDHLIAHQLAQLVPFQTPDGKRGWVHPAYREVIEELGM